MYKIAMRTYGRSSTFADRTYKFLKGQENINLSEQLYIFVANEEEKEKYTKALDNQPYKEIIVGVLGIKEVTDFMFNYFGDFAEVFFLDDDLYGFFEFPGNPSIAKINKESTKLDRYIKDGFEICRTEGITTFGFKSMQNPFYVKSKPFKEIRPHYLVGSAWGCVINKKLHETMFGHNEDMERSAKIIEAEGGSLVYNWAGFITHINNVGQGLNEGGMQSSGDRGDAQSRIEYTKKVTEILAKETCLPKYFNGPFFSEELQAWDWKIKSLTSLKKYPIKRKSWNYFGE